MGVIGIVLLVILIIASILLVLIVLVQDEQGEGIGGIFGGGSNTAFGSRSGNVLTRFTAILGAIFIVCCFGLAWVNRTPAAGDIVSKARQEALSSTDQKWYLPTATTETTAAAGTEQGVTSTESTTPAPSSQGGN